jgi:hypothetical protein
MSGDSLADREVIPWATRWPALLAEPGPFHLRATRTAIHLGEAMAAQAGTFFQRLRAVRSARSGRWDWQFPSSARARGTLQPDKCDTFGLTVHVQRLRNIPCTAAARAVIRTHTSPPSIEKIFYDELINRAGDRCALQNTNKITGARAAPLQMEAC